MYLGQQLVHDGVVYPSAPTEGATLPADCIKLIKDDDVQGTVFIQFLLVCLCLSKQAPKGLKQQSLTGLMMSHDLMVIT